jgi:hypothetical protein
MSSFNFDESVKSLPGWEEGRPNSEDIKRLKGECRNMGIDVGWTSLKSCFDEAGGSFVAMVQDELAQLSEDEEEGLDDDDDELSRMEAGTGKKKGGGKRKKSRRHKSKRHKSKRRKTKRKSKRSKSRRGKSRRGKSRI